MKKALALLGTIIFVFSIVPMGAFATDGDYPDHTNNIAPYVHSIIALFDNSQTYTVASSITDVEYWNNGSSLGTASGWTFNVPSNADCFDIDFWWPATAPTGNQVVGLLNVYIRELQNVDYIELYSQGTYEACPIYYYTYYNNQFFIVFPGQGISASSYYTLRIHIKQGGFQFNFLAGVDPIVYKYYTPDTNSSFQQQYADWYYLTSILRELDSMEISVTNLNIDMSNVQASLSLIESILRTNNYGGNYYLGDSPYKDKCGVFTIPNTGAYAGTMHTNYLSKFTNSGSGKGLSNSVVMLQFPMTSPSNFIQINIPIVTAPIYRPGVTYDIRYCVAPLAETTSAFNSYIDNGTIDFDKEYSSILNYKFTADKWILYVPIPTLTFPITSGAIYIYFHCEGYTSNAFTIKDSWSTENYSGIYCWAANHAGTKGSILTMDIMMRQLLFALQGLQASSGGAINVPDYPSGPSDPQDPNQTTNIYDVNIEFNTQVGDISVFENTYSQQLPTYDQSISDQYLVPVSNTYDFSDLNSTFNSIWQSSFQYDTDEEDNIVGVYGIGLYFIIPLVLLVLFALFRRITS